MIWAWLVGSAVAGQLGLAHPEDVYIFHTRSFSMTFWGSLPLGYETGDIGFDFYWPSKRHHRPGPSRKHVADCACSGGFRVSVVLTLVG